MRSTLCFLFALCALFAAPASAEWVKVSETDIMVV